ncbi:MAG: RNA polymerase sigma-70 factor, ECF subfamily [Candidatus Shapirobacteria bacterium GW2011_GWF2_37_20]|nr:MAG: RNA polymerase sigma-70 factor, ECF subfamily [Candidatus Shapirobacteria bacterium GW2011_GWF2_37_20]
MFNRNCQNLEDKELVALSLQDSQYFYCLMKRYEDKLTNYVRRFTYLSDDDIADVVQESFINTYQHLNDCDCNLKFSSWLYRIVHNQAINFIKKNKQSLKIEMIDNDDEFVDWLVADTDIEKETITKHFNDYVTTILEKLKPDYKEVLILKFFEDKDYQEISDILQKPMGTVATLLSRAKIQFKEIYEKEKKY